MNQTTFSDIEYSSHMGGILRNMSGGMELYTAYQGDTRSRKNQTFRDWLLDLII